MRHNTGFIIPLLAPCFALNLYVFRQNIFTKQKLHFSMAILLLSQFRSAHLLHRCLHSFLPPMRSVLSYRVRISGDTCCLSLTCFNRTAACYSVDKITTAVLTSNKMQQLFRLLIFLNQPYMFRATNSPILRSNFGLYIQLLVQCTDTAAERYHQKLYIQSKSGPEDGRIFRPKHVGLI